MCQPRNYDNNAQILGIHLEGGHGKTTLAMFYLNWATTCDLLNSEAQGAGQAVLRALPKASRVVWGLKRAVISEQSHLSDQVCL